MGCPVRVPELCRLHSNGQKLVEAVQTGRRNEEPGNPERIPARYATA